MMPRIALRLTDGARRLDVLLAKVLSDRGITRSQVQRLMAGGKVLVDGLPARASQEALAGQAVEIEFPEDRPFELVPKDSPLTILYEDESCLVVDKPAGLVTHPARGHWDDTLVNILASKDIGLSSGYAPGRPGIVHRLDKDTSGVLLIARTDAAQAFLAEQFKSRTVEKVYRALVWGQLENPCVEVSEPIGRDRRNRQKMAVVTGGRPARTVLRTLESLPHISLVEARPLTGRTHQIRVHLARIHHPVLGDFIYGGHLENGLPSTILRKKVREADRFFLHAHSLAFDSPGAGRVTVVSPMPTAFSDIMEAFKSHG
jgi:23S rRNA pseudouridine1911/1915/1917 synthase